MVHVFKVIALILIVVFFMSCAGKALPETKPKKEPAPPPQQKVEEEKPVDETIVEQTEKEEPAVDLPGLELDRIHFEFDDASITEKSKAILKHNAQLLLERPTVKVTIEGHCDERGTNEYNIALGERRAQSIRDYMTNLGIAFSRISTVSKGEEEPLVNDSTPFAYDQNRRGEFVPSR